LRVKNREDNRRVRAEARHAYEQTILDVTSDSLADSSHLASAIESSVAGALHHVFIANTRRSLVVTEALSLEQSTRHLQTHMHFERKV
jgi:hypothetical protein